MRYLTIFCLNSQYFLETVKDKKRFAERQQAPCQYQRISRFVWIEKLDKNVFYTLNITNSLEQCLLLVS